MGRGGLRRMGRRWEVGGEVEQMIKRKDDYEKEEKTKECVEEKEEEKDFYIKKNEKKWKKQQEEVTVNVKNKDCKANLEEDDKEALTKEAKDRLIDRHTDKQRDTWRIDRVTDRHTYR